jgi:hypothetical protein
LIAVETGGRLGHGGELARPRRTLANRQKTGGNARLAAGDASGEEMEDLEVVSPIERFRLPGSRRIERIRSAEYELHRQRRDAAWVSSLFQ